MHLVSDTLDDILLQLYPMLLSAPLISGVTRGANREILGASIQILKPRARLSRTETRGRPFSALGELLWYLSGDNQLAFIEPFVPAYREESEDKRTVYGGYGPRLFRQRGHNQIENVLTRLRGKPATRKAVIQLFNAEDLAEHHSEIPCTTTLQFLLRNHQLEMVTTMRSNDAYLGLPHDVFCFTMLQEIIARTLGCEIGTYRHFVASMHLYEGEHRNDRDAAIRLVEEGYQAKIEMPDMPEGDPWAEINKVQAALAEIRSERAIQVSDFSVVPYWSDLVRLLQIFAATGDKERITAIQQEMHSSCYKSYIDSRINMPVKANRFSYTGKT